MHADFVDALEMLPVPHADELSERRVHGTGCVWCGQQPTLSLGPRLSVIDGALSLWEPCACQACASREAARVQDVHAKTCLRCGGMDFCPDARALCRLAQAA